MKTWASISKLTGHALLALMLAAGPAFPEKRYGPGVTDTEIKIGQTMPYSGPLRETGCILDLSPFEQGDPPCALRSSWSPS